MYEFLIEHHSSAYDLWSATLDRARGKCPALAAIAARNMLFHMKELYRIKTGRAFTEEPKRPFLVPSRTMQ